MDRAEAKERQEFIWKELHSPLELLCGEGEIAVAIVNDSREDQTFEVIGPRREHAGVVAQSPLAIALAEPGLPQKES